MTGSIGNPEYQVHNRIHGLVPIDYESGFDLFLSLPSVAWSSDAVYMHEKPQCTATIYARLCSDVLKSLKYFAKCGK